MHTFTQSRRVALALLSVGAMFAACTSSQRSTDDTATTATTASTTSVATTAAPTTDPSTTADDPDATGSSGLRGLQPFADYEWVPLLTDATSRPFTTSIQTSVTELVRSFSRSAGSRRMNLVRQNG